LGLSRGWELGLIIYQGGRVGGDERMLGFGVGGLGFQGYQSGRVGGGEGVVGVGGGDAPVFRDQPEPFSI